MLSIYTGYIWRISDGGLIEEVLISELTGPRRTGDGDSVRGLSIRIGVFVDVGVNQTSSRI
jgi:hypothetical protein